MINSCPKAHCHHPFIKINIHASVKVAISSLLYVTLEGNYPNPSPCHVLRCVHPFGVLPSIPTPCDPMSQHNPGFHFPGYLSSPSHWSGTHSWGRAVVEPSWHLLAHRNLGISFFFFFNKKKNFIWSVHKNFNIVNLNSNIDTQTIKNIKEYHHTSFWQNKMVQVLVTKHCIVTFFLSND